MNEKNSTVFLEVTALNHDLSELWISSLREAIALNDSSQSLSSVKEPKKVKAIIPKALDAFEEESTDDEAILYNEHEASNSWSDDSEQGSVKARRPPKLDMSNIKMVSPPSSATGESSRGSFLSETATVVDRKASIISSDARNSSAASPLSQTSDLTLEEQGGRIISVSAKSDDTLFSPESVYKTLPRIPIPTTTPLVNLKSTPTLITKDEFLFLLSEYNKKMAECKDLTRCLDMVKSKTQMKDLAEKEEQLDQTDIMDGYY